ncbi:MAG: hypothetical protein GWN37_12665 [Gammaproteobacteria bacterium]|nr:hypothetical protein [Gammaproteobacteria bacterium]
MTHPRDAHEGERLRRGYETMLHRARTALAEHLPTVREAVDHAKEKAVELGELTREEAERVREYLRRDLEDAGAYLADTRREFADWLHLERDLIESRLLDSMAALADQTRLEYEKLAVQAQRAGERHTGEVVGPGTLRCTQCDERLQFRESGHVPPCPRCHGTTFRRASR